jgi:glycosyltransferase involved in cell wall biosynthesis
MGGIGRPYALFRHLPEYGYDVTVLTVKKILYPEYDYSLVDAGDEKSIIRTESADPARILYLLGRRKQRRPFSGISKIGLIYYPDVKRAWNYFALRKARHILKKGNYCAIVSTSPPPSTHLVGMKIRKSFDIPWVADFRDFWFSLPIEMIYPTSFQRIYAHRLKKDIIAAADRVVSVNSCIRDYLGAGEVIMNGTDIEAAGLWQSAPGYPGEKFTIGVLGTINQLTPIEPLFRTVASLLKNRPSLHDKISIVHVGHYENRDVSRLLEMYSLKDIADFRGYLPKREAIETLNTVDMLYLAVNRFENYHILPGRIFDYLTSGKPVLGMVPSGSDAASLLDEFEYGHTCDPDNYEAASESISRMYNERATGRRPSGLDKSGTYRYSTLSMAEKYAALLDGITK